MPLELWVQAVAKGLRIVEMAVPLIYLDESRSFGGALDDAQSRLDYYDRVLARAIAAAQSELAAAGRDISPCAEILSRC
jgi:dolichol-phosphate mannosyltransferase